MKYKIIESTKNKKKNLKKKIQKKKRTKKEYYKKKKELVLYINEILKLNKITIYNMKKDKVGIIARIIYENSKKFFKWQQRLNQRFNNPIKRKRRIIKKKSKKKNNEQKLSYWDWRKRTIFNNSKLPKYRKTKNRLKFVWPLKLLTRISSLRTPKFYLYYRKPRKILLKKKICIKKMLYYYYNISFNKSIKGFINFSKKQRHIVTIQYSNNFTNILESKLCIFLLRIRFASNIWISKQFITKGYICVNGDVNFNPGYLLNINDIVQWVWNSYIEYKIKYFKKLEISRIGRCFAFWKLKKFKSYGAMIKTNIKTKNDFKLYYKFNFIFDTFFLKKSIKNKIKRRKFYFDIILEDKIE